MKPFSAYLLMLLALVACVGAGTNDTNRKREDGRDVQNAPESSQLRVDVTVATIHLRGGTVEITHVVHNRRSSRDSLVTFLVAARSGILRMRRPEPGRNWAAFQDFSGRPMANWGFLQPLLPDSTTPPLYYESVGIPGVANYWVGGEVPPKGGEEDEPDPKAAVSDPLETEMTSGQTVGVEPWPANRSSLGLIARLSALTDQSCAKALSWITSSTLCDQLKNDLNEARLELPGNPTRARSHLNDFIARLTGPTPGAFPHSVTSSGYWLLKSNAEIILRQL